MSKTKEEKKVEQQIYYIQLNEILVKVQTEELSQREGEIAINKLNSNSPDVDSKASVCILEAMTDEYANFDENSNC